MISDKRVMREPIFITFEGGEGAGKSTQAKLLSNRLAALGREVVLTREPGGSDFAEHVRNVLLSAQTPAHDALAETLLFYAARADHLTKTIRPALARGADVICDRFSDSTRVYQGIAGGLSSQTIDTLENLVVAPTRPHLTIVLDLPAEHGLARADQRHNEAAKATVGTTSPRDSYEARDLSFHKRLRDGFLSLAASDPAQYEVVDAQQDIDVIAKQIWNALSALIDDRDGER